MKKYRYLSQSWSYGRRGGGHSSWYVHTHRVHQFQCFPTSHFPLSNTWATGSLSDLNSDSQLEIRPTSLICRWTCRVSTAANANRMKKKGIHHTHTTVHSFCFASRSADRIPRATTQRHSSVKLTHLKRCTCNTESPDGLLARFPSLQTSRSRHRMESVSSAADGL